MRAIARASRALRSRPFASSAALLGASLRSAQPALQVGPQRLLSSRKQPKKEDKPDLAEAIAAEIQDEIANDELDQEYVDCRESVLKRFSIAEELGSSVTKLSRTHGKEQIEVVFSCIDEEEGFGGEEELEEEGEADAGPGYGINFDVKVSKEQLGSVVFKCTATGAGKLEIHHLQYLPVGKSDSDVELYGGPKFDTLNDTVQTAALDYLAEKGIDDDLCFFVLSHSAHKEQKEYENWLAKYASVLSLMLCLILF